ncbi:MAG: excinuclease ABC subunit UvrA [bacterium]
MLQVNRQQSTTDPTQKIIKIRGARVNNLKNIDVDIPRNQLVVITGLSGSGKSSLAFDTIYAEGQRRYVESLSSYARQFIGLMNKPEVDSIEGLSPAISIDQRTAANNPRSTVGTITEIYDYLRLLYARAGTVFCPQCGQAIKPYSKQDILKKINSQFAGRDIKILAPLVQQKTGDHKDLVDRLRKTGFKEVHFDGQLYSLSDFAVLEVAKNKVHNLEIVIDRFTLASDKDSQELLKATVERSLDLANGLVMVLSVADNKTQAYSQLLTCLHCDFHLLELEPRNFSFNSPHGACPDCAGLGTKLEVVPELVLNKRLTIAQGAIKPWLHATNGQSTKMKQLIEVANRYKFDLNTPVKNLAEEHLQIILYGDKKTAFSGVVADVAEHYVKTDSDYMRKELEDYMQEKVCSTCQGQRLRKEYLAVAVANKSIYDLSVLPIDQLQQLLANLQNDQSLTSQQRLVAEPIIKEVVLRLQLLMDVGLAYLTLDRRSTTISGGEAQRIRLATQIGTNLVGVVYILDEPSIGLHQRDNDKLIKTLQKLRDLENTVIVVEHDEAMMRAADYIIDVGPGAGSQGGQIIATGTLQEIKNNKNSLTGQYLSGQQQIAVPKKYRSGHGQAIQIIGAQEHNLKNINVEIPLGKFVAITGVSGSGKSTLLNDILAKALSQKFYRAKATPGQHQEIKGLDKINKVINIDQSPIGRAPRSNPATYTGLFSPIRDLFAATPEAQLKNFKAGHFSFNVQSGRCETCSGDGVLKIEMQFLSDVYVKCDACQGKRYQREVLDIYYHGKNISDVLAMSVDEAKVFFRHISAVYQKLNILSEVGLGYLSLGQSATTLSGGEAQRIKLATELSRRATGKTLYILDEPTTGLHFDDIKRLLKVLNKLVDKGNTVLIIEHNLDVIKSVDWVIDLGPEGGAEGGYVVAAGTPKDVAKIKTSYTGQYLKEVLS